MGTDQVPSPIKVVGEEHPLPTKAPTVGEHTDEILRDVLGYDDERIADAPRRRAPSAERVAASRLAAS